MNDKILSNNELKFLKFINGKNINIEFSTRWKFQYEINQIKK